MSETPKDPGQGESTLDGRAEAKWETVAPPAVSAITSAPASLPAAPATNAGYGNLGAYAAMPGYGTPVNVPPTPPLPPPAGGTGAAGYQQAHGGSPAQGGTAGAGYGPPVYGSQPVGYPPSGGYGGTQPPYGQPGFSQQGNYGANVAELLAVGALMTGARRQRRFVRHLILWPLLIFGFIVFLLIRGCFGLISSAGKPEIHALHDRMKHDDLASIYSSADEAYRTQHSRAQSDALFEAVHRQLGDPLSYDVRSVNTITNNSAGTKRLVLATEFSRGSATETVRFNKSEGEYKLESYQVDSPTFKFDGTVQENTF